MNYESEPTMSISPLRILVVEDNPVSQRVAIRLVEKLGHDTEVASNGQLALDAIQRGAFDIILMDVQMPVLDGLEATRELRTREAASGRHLPVIGMTAGLTSKDQDACLAAGMDDYVSKPVVTSELAAAISRVLLHGQPAGHQPALQFTDRESQRASVCDLRAALKLLDNDEAFLLQLTELFLDTIPDRLICLKNAIEDLNTELVSDLAHSIKGSVRYFAAESAYAAAERLEIIGRTGDVNAIQTRYRLLRSEVGQLQIELAGFMRSARPTSQMTGVV